MANNRFHSYARTAHVRQAESESVTATSSESRGGDTMGKIARILKDLLEGSLSAVSVYLSGKS